MNTLNSHQQVVDALGEIAPDADPGDVDADLHDVLGLDSMDLLNLAAAIERSTGITISERDYPSLRTIRQLQEYVAAHVRSDARLNG